MPKNLVIGAITNYTWDDIAPFFNSYKKAGFKNCGCVMFTGNMSGQTTGMMKACGADAVPIPERFSGGCVNDFRWELYADYLREHAKDYGLIFTADVRDTVFQSDVFRFCDGSSPFLGIALEDDFLTQGYNKDWLIQRYSHDVWESISSQRTICSGTVWGTAAEFLAFASEMSGNINSKDYPYFNICDQAACNWLVYHEGMFREIITASTNQDGYVMTIGFTPTDKLSVNEAGMILNGRGEIASVVHQYDRKPSLTRIVVRKYGEGMSIFAKLSLKHNSDFAGRVMRFLSRIHRKGLIRTASEAVKRRIH